jgi:hypothetical protein
VTSMLKAEEDTCLEITKEGNYCHCMVFSNDAVLFVDIMFLVGFCTRWLLVAPGEYLS